MSDFWADAEIISVYTRADAIRDGVLVDLMQPDTVGAVREAGFRIPLAMTTAAFDQTVAYLGKDDLPAGQDLQGRLWDVLFMLHLAIKRQDAGRELLFRLVVRHEPGRQWAANERRQGRGKRMRLTTLKALCGPGDEGEPVITIMQPDED